MSPGHSKKKAALIVMTLAVLTCSALLTVLLSAGPSGTVTDKEVSKKAAGIKKKVPKEFVIIESTPFVVVGNITKAQANRYLKGTIKAAAEAFNNQYFEKKPDKVITVYLFKDDKTYRHYAKKLFDDNPSTPYGYFTAGSNRLVMNIATGGGTLVHELFHALVRYDLEKIPDWFNEGMGSLYEQCHISGGKIKGAINWRFPILLKHLKKGDCAKLADVIKSKGHDFYDKDNGSNYAVARYFCMYMQEQGVLEKFYKEFRSNIKKDPTGTKTAEKVLGKKIPEIEKDWLQWVKKLAEKHSSR